MENAIKNLKGKKCVITGGGGVIGTSITEGLAKVGVECAILDISFETAEKVASQIEKKTGTKTIGVMGNVLDKNSLYEAKKIINAKLGKIDFIINGAGGNSPKATTAVEFIDENSISSLEKTFFGLELEGFEKVFDLNFIGTILPTMVFSTDLIEKKNGVIINISSMNSFRPLTKIPAYSAAKAAINNFTEWLAVHMAKAGIRVNAIAPGFFLTNQNRFLLTDEKTGELTPRGHKIIAGTPMGKFGEPDDLIGTTVYLLSEMSSFVTGVVIPVDGGFNAYSGV
jgi:NAD(P)-dependent dehydrogenase (short-subunit alcohol dehydrogenase family)